MLEHNLKSQQEFTTRSQRAIFFVLFGAASVIVLFANVLAVVNVLSE